MYKTPKGFFDYVIMPFIGAASVGILWINLEASSLIMGGIWFAVGFGYLLYITKAFRAAPPAFKEEAQL
jgi:putrescine importer